MADAAFTARATSKAHVYAEIVKLPFAIDDGRYTHDDAAGLVIGLGRSLTGTYNPTAEGRGMKDLLRSSADATTPSALAAIKSTDTETAKTILAKSAAEAGEEQAASSTPETAITAKITTRADAVDAADRANILIQAVIGAKEGATNAIVAKVGSGITDAVLLTSDGVHHKSVDEYELFELVNAIMQAAVRPQIADIRRKFVAYATTEFDFRKLFAHNAAGLRTSAAKLSSYGILSSDNTLAAIILAETDRAAREPFGREIESAMDRIRSRYAYDFAHDASSVVVILRELAAADGVRDLTLAPAPSAAGATGHASHAAAAVDAHTARRLVFDEDNTTDESEWTHASATTDGHETASSVESTRASKKKARGRERRDKQRADRADQTVENNPCKYCRKYKRTARHPHLPEERCYFNKKWKGWRPQYVCAAIKIKFRKKYKFPVALGGTAEDETSDEESK